MSDVIRYTGYAGADAEPDGFYLREPESGETGHWIRASDYDALLAERDALKALVEEAYDQMDIVRGSWFERARKALGMPEPKPEEDRMCKHDDGDCHWDDPCDNCPVYRKSPERDAEKHDGR